MDIDKATNVVSAVPEWFYDVLAYLTPAIASLVLLAILGFDVFAALNSVIRNEYVAAVVLLVVLYIYGQLTSTYSHSLKYIPHRLFRVFRWLLNATLKKLELALNRWPTLRLIQYLKFVVEKSLQFPDPIIGSYPTCKPPLFLGFNEDGSTAIGSGAYKNRPWQELSGTNRRMLLVSYFRIIRPTIANDILKTYARIKISRALLWNVMLFVAIAVTMNYVETGYKSAISEDKLIVLGVVLLVIFFVDFIARERWLSGTLASAVEAENQYIRMIDNDIK